MKQSIKELTEEILTVYAPIALLWSFAGLVILVLLGLLTFVTVGFISIISKLVMGV